MKSLHTPFISALNSSSAAQAAEILSHALPLESIGIANWPSSYGYKPVTTFKVARSADHLFIYFDVTEKSVKASYVQDQDPVWTDSCVEAFFQIPGRNFYYNFEFNCIGTCIATAREGKSLNVKPFDSELLKRIDRYASLGNQAFEEKIESTNWQLCVKIPFELMELDPGNLPPSIRGNFYKCGDETRFPHYVSWSEIQVAEPDFHRPDFFGDLCF